MHYSLSFLAIATSAFLVSSTYASSEPIESVASGPSMSSHSLTSTGSFTHHPMPMGTGEAHENHWTKKPLGTWIDKPIGMYREDHDIQLPKHSAPVTIIGTVMF